MAPAHAQGPARSTGSRHGHQAPQDGVVVAVARTQMRTAETGAADGQSRAPGSREPFRSGVGVQNVHRRIDDDDGQRERVQRRGANAVGAGLRLQPHMELQGARQVGEHTLKILQFMSREGAE